MNNWNNSIPRDDFGCHPVGRADHRLALVTVGRQLRAESEVSELHLAVHTEQNVVGLDVTVDDILPTRYIDISL